MSRVKIGFGKIPRNLGYSQSRKLYRYFSSGLTVCKTDITMKHQVPSFRSIPNSTASQAKSFNSGKRGFPEDLLRESEGVRKAGLSCVKRMPAYLQMLRVLQAEGHEHVSGTVLAGAHNLEPVIVRKDLAKTGAVGTPRIGFHITDLIAAIERFLGWDNQTKAVLVGVGSLGTALLGYQGIQNFGFRFVGAFDCDPKIIGKWVHGRKVQAMNQLLPFVRRGEIAIGVLAVPAEFAQATAELMVSAGVIGGVNSNNTRELMVTCAKFCPSVHHIQTAADLRLEWFTNAKTVGLTAGTSTPDEIIEHVEARLMEFAARPYATAAETFRDKMAQEPFPVVDTNDKDAFIDSAKTRHPISFVESPGKTYPLVAKLR